MTAQPYEHLNPQIYQLIKHYNHSGVNAEDAQKLLRRMVREDGSIDSDKPLECMLGIVASHAPHRRDGQWNDEVAFLSKYLNGLQSIHKDREGRLVNQASPHYQKFTDLILQTPDFPYGREEARVVGNLYGQRDLFGHATATSDAIIDRIVLRKCLEGVQDQQMKEHIWYAITLAESNFDTIKYLKAHCPDKANIILREIETKVAPAYDTFLTTLESPERNNDGIQQHGEITLLRKQFLRSVVVAAELRLDYEPVNGRSLGNLMPRRRIK